MRLRLYPLAWTIVALGVGVFGATNCGDDKSPTLPSGPATPILVAIEMAGPATIPPGGTGQFNIRGTWSDGRVGEVTSGITWRSTNTTVISIDASGRALGLERGTAAISAAIDGRTAGKSVLVLPNGTFRLSGWVHDTAARDIPIALAVVEAGVGSDTLTALTDARGQFALYGVQSGAVLRVSKDGYTTHEQQLQLTTHIDLAVPLGLARSRLNIAGTYVLSIGSSQCDAGLFAPLAEELRERTYTAVVTQNNERATIKLTGRDFASSSGRVADTFSGNVGPSGATFELRDVDYYYGTVQDVVERLANGTFLTITGHAVTTATDFGFAGTLNGTLLNVQTLPTGTIVGRCFSRTHPFTLRR